VDHHESDLTRPNPGVPPNIDEATANDYNTDGHRNNRRGVIYTVAPSLALKTCVWAGTDDGFIQVTTNDGQSWQNVTPPALTAWSRITTIEASHFDVNEAYATVDRHQLGDFDPHLYRTRDLGKTWAEVVTGLPKGVYLHAVREDPQRRGLLIAGSELGVFVSFNDGRRPGSPCKLESSGPRRRPDFEIYGNDLIVATHGPRFLGNR